MLLVGTGAAAVDPLGIVASVAAMLLSSLGYVLASRWSRSSGTPAPGVLAVTSWQLLAGGVVLLPVAVVAEGGPPAFDAESVAAFAFVSLVATALAFSCWFAGLAHLDPGTVGLLGLLNPLTGVALGTALAGERLTGPQLLGVLLVLAAVVAGQPRQPPSGTCTDGRPGASTATGPRTYTVRIAWGPPPRRGESCHARSSL